MGPIGLFVGVSFVLLQIWWCNSSLSLYKKNKEQKQNFFKINDKG